jgi:Zinc knuckle
MQWTELPRGERASLLGKLYRRSIPVAERRGAISVEQRAFADDIGRRLGENDTVFLDRCLALIRVDHLIGRDWLYTRLVGEARSALVSAHRLGQTQGTEQEVGGASSRQEEELFDQSFHTAAPSGAEEEVRQVLVVEEEDEMDANVLQQAIAAAVTAALQAANQTGRQRTGGLKGLKDAPRYDGKADVRVWLRQFEAYAAATPWETEEQLRALNIVLQSSAGDWLWSQEQHPAPDGEEPEEKLVRLKRGLTARFGRVLTQAADYSQLYALRQGQKESVDELVERLDALERRLPEGTPENVKKFAFINALRARLRVEVEKEGPVTLEGALVCARRHEDILLRVYGDTRVRPGEEAQDRSTQPRRGREHGVEQDRRQEQQSGQRAREWSPVGPDGLPWRRRREERSNGVYSRQNPFNMARPQSEAPSPPADTAEARRSRAVGRPGEQGGSAAPTGRAGTNGARGTPNWAANQRRQAMSPLERGNVQKSPGNREAIVQGNTAGVSKEREVDKLTERVEALSLNRAGLRQDANYKQGWKCYNCGQPGHLRNECPF